MNHKKRTEKKIYTNKEQDIPALYFVNELDESQLTCRRVATFVSRSDAQGFAAAKTEQNRNIYYNGEKRYHYEIIMIMPQESSTASPKLISSLEPSQSTTSFGAPSAPERKY